MITPRPLTPIMLSKAASKLAFTISCKGERQVTLVVGVVESRLTIAAFIFLDEKTYTVNHLLWSQMTITMKFIIHNVNPNYWKPTESKVFKWCISQSKSHKELEYWSQENKSMFQTSLETGNDLNAWNPVSASELRQKQAVFKVIALLARLTRAGKIPCESF